MKPSIVTFSALLTIVVVLSVTAHADASIPIFARSCSLCRMYGTPRTCTTYNRSYTQCIGMYFDSEAACVKRAGMYVSEPKEGCFMV